MKIKASCSNGANWKQVDVKSRIPKELDKLEELARNMWWAWNHDARVLFRSLDEDLFDEVGQNPVLLLERLSYEKMEELSKDSSVVRKMNDVYAAFREYMDVEPDKTRPSVAYFCMEYGLNHVLKIYSGGLGVLAGDYLKEASDSNVDMCAVSFIVMVILRRLCPWMGSRLQITRHRISAACRLSVNWMPMAIQ